jgi:protein tyrosine phosphatase (PTP) superfamily phosphohydrolase (DUF442 family)
MRTKHDRIKRRRWIMFDSKDSAENPNGFKFKFIPAFLRTESEEDFEKLVDELERAVQPTNFVELMYVHDVAVRTWDIMRHRRNKAGIINNAFHAALENFLQRYLSPPKAAFYTLEEISADRLVANRLAYDWFYSQEAKDQVSGLLEEAGFNMQAIEAEAVRLALADIEKLDGLIASAEARRDKYLRSLARSEDGLATKLEESSTRRLAADSVPSIASSSPAD